MTVTLNLIPPKNVFLKQGKIFDLDTIDTDQYQLILLSSTTNLTLDGLDKFDASLASYESDPANYTKPTVALQLNETTDGYQINVVGNSITVNLVSATVQGALLVKTSTMDILGAALYADAPVSYTLPMNIVVSDPIVTFKREQVSSS